MSNLFVHLGGYWFIGCVSNSNDILMERLADAGNGRYAYVTTLDEPECIFVNKMMCLGTFNQSWIAQPYARIIEH